MSVLNIQQTVVDVGKKQIVVIILVILLIALLSQ